MKFIHNFVLMMLLHFFSCFIIDCEHSFQKPLLFIHWLVKYSYWLITALSNNQTCLHFCIDLFILKSLTVPYSVLLFDTLKEIKLSEKRTPSIQDSGTDLTLYGWLTGNIYQNPMWLKIFFLFLFWSEHITSMILVLIKF